MRQDPDPDLERKLESRIRIRIGTKTMPTPQHWSATVPRPLWFVKWGEHCDELQELPDSWPHLLACEGPAHLHHIWCPRYYNLKGIVSLKSYVKRKCHWEHFFYTPKFREFIQKRRITTITFLLGRMVNTNL